MPASATGAMAMPPCWRGGSGGRRRSTQQRRSTDHAFHGLSRVGVVFQGGIAHGLAHFEEGRGIGFGQGLHAIDVGGHSGKVQSRTYLGTPLSCPNS